MNNEKNSFLGRKIIYSLVIVMSSLILLLSVAGIIGVWVVERPIADASVTVLKVVENSSGVVRQSVSRVDQVLATLEARTTDIANSSQQLSQNVTDKGLVMVLLPEEKEQQLRESANSIRETYNEISATITSGIELYRSINRIPFINLPSLSADQVKQIETSTTQTQELAATLQAEVGEFRSGVSGAIDRVQTTADLLTEEIRKARQDLAQLDDSLAALEALAIRLQQAIPRLLIAVAVLLSLIFIFMIFTQVEVIRLYIGRWRSLDHSPNISSVEPALEQNLERESGSETE